MVRSIAVLAVVGSLAACSTAQWEEMRANPREFFNLTAPTMQTDARVDGGQVVLKRGQALVVRLDEDATTGQRWEMKALPAGAVVAPVQHDFVARDDKAAVAGTGDGTFRLRGIAPGSQTIVLELRGPREPAAAKTVRFDVVVR